MYTKIKFLIGLIIVMFGVAPILTGGNIFLNPLADTTSSKIEVFTFTSNGKKMKGKIYLPASYTTSKSLPAIFLIDFTEQHFKLATDEFEKVIDGVQQIEEIGRAHV